MKQNSPLLLSLPFMAKVRNLYGRLNLKTFNIMKTRFLFIALFVTCLSFGNNDPKPTNETVKTLFGTEMEIQNVTLCKYKNVAFYVAIGSPIANLYKNDHFKFEIFMSLHLNDYKNENKIFLNS